MVRYFIALLIIAATVILSAALFFPDYWIHRYDELITRQARIYRLDERLVWSVIYEETYFRAWIYGADGEIGLMQVTPLVARDWARETGFKEYERLASEEPETLLKDPERNIQIGSWYLEKLRERYRGRPAETAMTLAAYNAGPSRVEEWTSGSAVVSMSEADFVSRIGFQSTQRYVGSILERYRAASPLK